MMENKLFRWIAFAVMIVLAIVAIIVGTISGFFCFAAAAFILIPVNRLFEKLDVELDPKYRKRATVITVGIFLVCGLLAFTTAGNGSDSKTDKDTGTTTTTVITTTTERTTEPTTTTTKETTTATEATTTTAETTTTTSPVAETDPPTAQERVESSAAQSEITYVLNYDSMKFHYPDCSSAEDISLENRGEYTGNRDDLINQKYTPCGRCNP